MDAILSIAGEQFDSVIDRMVSKPKYAPINRIHTPIDFDGVIGRVRYESEVNLAFLTFESPTGHRVTYKFIGPKTDNLLTCRKEAIDSALIAASAIVKVFKSSGLWPEGNLYSIDS